MDNPWKKYYERQHQAVSEDLESVYDLMGVMDNNTTDTREYINFLVAELARLHNIINLYKELEAR